MPLFSGRPTVGEVDLGALEFNYWQIRRRIPEGVKILAVVKADAYGHGAIPVSLKLEKLGVEYFGVAIPEEGMELRKGGGESPHSCLRRHVWRRGGSNFPVPSHPGNF